MKFIVFIVVFIQQYIFAQNQIIPDVSIYNGNPQIVWQKTFGGNLDDRLISIQKTIDKGYICGGYSNSSKSGDNISMNNGGWDFWILKLDSLGNIQWQKTIGGNNSDNLFKIVQTSDHGYICGGYSDSGISGDKTEASIGNIPTLDFWIIKLDSIGNIQWQNTIGGNDTDVLIDINQTNDGGYICCGHMESGFGGDLTVPNHGWSDYWILKLDANGNILWQKSIGGTRDDYVKSIKQTTDGGYICGGTSNSQISGNKTEINFGSNDFWIIKLDYLGNITWQKTFGGNKNDNFHEIIETQYGYILGGDSQSDVSGNKSLPSNGYFDFWIVKLDKNGNMISQNIIGGSKIEDFKSFKITPDGGLICGGNISNYNDYSSYDYFVVKLDQFGNIQWKNSFGGNDVDLLFSLDTTDNGYICGGFSKSGRIGDKLELSKGLNDYWIIKLKDKPYGNIYVDNNVNCEKDSLEYNMLDSILISIQPGNFTTYAIDGYYSFELPEGSYSATIDTSFFKTTCDPTINFSISSLSNNLPSFGMKWMKTSIEIPFNSIIKVYPNPNNGLFRVELPSNMPSTPLRQQKITICNVMGQVVYISTSLNDQSIEIDLSKQPNGIYFLKFENGEMEWNKKVVKN